MGKKRGAKFWIFLMAATAIVLYFLGRFVREIPPSENSPAALAFLEKVGQNMFSYPSIGVRSIRAKIQDSEGLWRLDPWERNVNSSEIQKQAQLLFFAFDCTCYEEMKKFGVFTIAELGDYANVKFTPKKENKIFNSQTTFVFDSYRLVRVDLIRDGQEIQVVVKPTKIGAKYVVASLDFPGEPYTRFEYAMSGEIPVIKKMNDTPVQLEMN